MSGVEKIIREEREKVEVIFREEMRKRMGEIEERIKTKAEKLAKEALENAF